MSARDGTTTTLIFFFCPMIVAVINLDLPDPQNIFTKHFDSDNNWNNIAEYATIWHGRVK
jgi:hypothetical protein